MDLQQTIDELERKAEQYRQAAEQIRALLSENEIEPPASAPSNAAANKSADDEKEGKGTGKAGKTKKTRKFSPETRARLSEAMKARHAARKAAAA